MLTTYLFEDTQTIERRSGHSHVGDSLYVYHPTQHHPLAIAKSAQKRRDLAKNTCVVYGRVIETWRVQKMRMQAGATPSDEPLLT
jgi:hypothetical protein